MSAELSTFVSEQPGARLSLNRIWRRMLTVFIGGLIVSQSVGCFCGPGLNDFRKAFDDNFDQQMKCYRNQVWAKRAFNLRYASCRRDYENHFSNGFRDGYRAICNGEKGYVPAMPPEGYWGNEFQCPEGAKCVDAWFKGYPAGVQAAKRDGSGSYNEVYISKMINSAIKQDKAKDSLPTDVPVKSAQGVTPKKQIVPRQLAPVTKPTQTRPRIPTLLPEVGQGQIMAEPGMSTPPLPMIIRPAEYKEPTEY